MTDELGKIKTMDADVANDGWMEREALPRTCLIDTGVLIRALRDKRDEDTPGCVAFFDSMLKHGHKILIATPSLAEAYRGNPAFPVPTTPQVEPVPFDRRAAELFGTHLTIDVLKARSLSTGLYLSYIKYDAMIVAVAKRFDVECIVAIDGDHANLAQLVGLRARMPHEFMLPIYRDMEEKRIARRTAKTRSELKTEKKRGRRKENA